MGAPRGSGGSESTEFPCPRAGVDEAVPEHFGGRHLRVAARVRYAHGARGVCAKRTHRCNSLYWHEIAKRAAGRLSRLWGPALARLTD